MKCELSPVVVESRAEVSDLTVDPCSLDHIGCPHRVSIISSRVTTRPALAASRYSKLSSKRSDALPWCRPARCALEG